MNPVGVRWRTRKKRNDDFGITDEDGYTAHLGVERFFDKRHNLEDNTPDAIHEKIEDKVSKSATTEDIELVKHQWVFEESQILDLITQAADLEHFEELFNKALQEAESQ